MTKTNQIERHLLPRLTAKFPGISMVLQQTNEYYSLVIDEIPGSDYPPSSSHEIYLHDDGEWIIWDIDLHTPAHSGTGLDTLLNDMETYRWLWAGPLPPETSDQDYYDYEEEEEEVIQ